MNIILFVALAVVWVLLVGHWWKRKDFFPILGYGRATKIWWGVLFLLFNPLLMLLYIVYGVFHRPKEDKPVSERYLKIARIMVIGLTVSVIAVFKIPWGGDFGDDGRVVRHGEKKRGSGLKVKATTYESSSNTSSMGTKCNTGNARFLSRRIHITNESDHPMMDKVARQIQQALAVLPYVDEVAYYPAGAQPETAVMLPDVFVTLRMPSFDRDRLPMRRAVKATVVCEVASQGPRSRYSRALPNDPPLVDHGLTITIEHKSTVVGVESPGAVYDQEAGTISQAITKKTIEDFKAMIDDHGFLPDLPKSFYGPYEPAPPMPFATPDASTRILNGYGLLIKNRTVWTYRDDRPTSLAMAALRDELAEEGWTGGKKIEEEENPLAMHLHRGKEYLTVFRRDAPRSVGFSLKMEEIVDGEPEKSPPLPAPEPMIAKYERRFTDQEFESVIARLVEEGPNVDAMLMFARGIKSKDLKQRLRERLSENTPGTVVGCLELAELWREEEETDKAWALIDTARVLERCKAKHGYKSDAFKRLAKELGDEERVKQPIPERAFREAGLVPVSGLTNRVTGTVKMGEPFGFYIVKDDGDIKTFVYTVVEHSDPSVQQKAIPETDPRHLWRLLDVRKERHMSSVGYDHGHIRDGKWEVQDYLHDGQSHAQIRVRETRDNQFEWSAGPH